MARRSQCRSPRHSNRKKKLELQKEFDNKIEEEKKSSQLSFYNEVPAQMPDVAPVNVNDRRFEKFKISKNDAVDKLFAKKEFQTGMNEMDIFILETKQNKKITDLINKVVYQIQGDRENRAKIELAQESLNRRIEHLEDSTGTSRSGLRPHFLEDIDSKISNIRSLI